MNEQVAKNSVKQQLFQVMIHILFSDSFGMIHPFVVHRSHNHYYWVLLSLSAEKIVSGYLLTLLITHAAV